jgi:hypothetical protein
MAARDRMQDAAGPLLEDDELIRRIFPAASGLNPLFGIIATLSGLLLTNANVSIFYGIGLVLLAQSRNLVVAVTDRATVVMESGMVFPFRPKSVMDRLPGDTVIGPAGGFLWKRMHGISEALGTPVRVHFRYAGDQVSVTKCRSVWTLCPLG